MAIRSVALEFESTAVKAVFLEVSARKAKILKAVSIPLGDIARYPESEAKNIALAKLLIEALPPQAFRCDNVFVSLSGRSSMLRFVNAPPVSERRLETILTFEAESQAVGNRGGLAFDYLPLDIPGQGGTSLVALSVAQLATLKSLAQVCERAGFKKVRFAPSSLGLSNAYVEGHGSDPNETVLIADIGANNITLVLVTNGRFVFARTIAGGGNRITTLISESLGLPVSDADERKIRRAQFLTDEKLATASDEEKALHRAVSSGAGIIGGAIESTLLFIKTQLGQNDLLINKLMLTGGSSRIPGIDSAFSARLNMSVERLHPLLKLEQKDEIENDDLLASCIGLALGAAGKGEICDLRTSEERERENYRRHDRFVWVAAPMAILLLLVALAALFWYGKVYAGYSEDFAKKLATAKKERAEFDKMRATLELKNAEIEYLLGMTSGPAYLLETLNKIKAILDDEKNMQRFETFFFERIYFGEESRTAKRTPTNPFGMRTTRTEEKTDKYPPNLKLIGWCRVGKPSTAIDIASEFGELMKEEKLIVDCDVRSLEEIKEDKPDKEWVLKPYLIQFEITLKMAK